MSRLLQSENEAHQFLGCVGDRNIVVLSFCPFFGKVGGKGGVPQTDILGGVVNGVAKVSRASFFHVRIAILELSGHDKTSNGKIVMLLHRTLCSGSLVPHKPSGGI